MLDKLDQLRDKLKAAAAAMGLELEIGTMTYGQNRATFSCQAFDGVEGHKEAFAKVARKKGFNPAWFGLSFTKDGVVHTITGAKARARKYPIVTSSSEGEYVWTQATVSAKMHMQGVS